MSKWPVRSKPQIEKIAGAGAGYAGVDSTGAVSGGGVVCACALAIATLSAIAASAGTRRESGMTESLLVERSFLTVVSTTCAKTLNVDNSYSYLGVAVPECCNASTICTALVRNRVSLDTIGASDGLGRAAAQHGAGFC